MAWLRRWFGLMGVGFRCPSSCGERRQYPRVRANQHLRQIGYDVDTCHFVTQTVDISEGGLKFTSREPFNPEDILQLAVTIEEKNKEILFLGRVAWSREDKSQKNSYRSGLSFIAIDERDRGLIREYVQEQLADRAVAA